VVIGDLEDLPALVVVARVGGVDRRLPCVPRLSLLVSATYTLPVFGLASKSSGRSILVAPAARAEPAPTASTAMPLACSTDRRDTAFAMSPKYSLSLVLGTGLEHASPHL
jgi:hypothetical protein